MLKMFQFHSGLIKRSHRLVKTLSRFLFQFHSGLIKSLRKGRTCEPQQSLFQFHSGLIKRRQGTAARSRHLSWFQFHSGLIKRPFCHLLFSGQPCFNSILV